MNPYQILQVSTNATDDEIKRAYRNAVKKYHPDVTGAGNNEIIALVNEAFDILSNPEQRRAYDAGLFSVENHLVVEEDPREVYRQAYIRKKREEARQMLALKKKIFNSLRFLNIFITVVALALAIDEFLPTLDYYDEYGVDEWVVVRRLKGSRYYIMYFQTNHFTFNVPHKLSFDYNFNKRPPIIVKCSPIFRVPTEVQIPTDSKKVIFEPSRTIYSFKFPFHYLLLLSCAISWRMKRFSSMAYSVVFAPLMFLLLAWAMFHLF